MAPDTELMTPGREALAPIVAHLLDAPRAEVAAWSAEPIHGGLDTSSAVLRVRGTAQTSGATCPWTVILKVCRPVLGREDPTGAFYWRREACAYESGLLADLAPGLVGPRCFGVDDRGGEVWLWLEDVVGPLGTQWSPDQALTGARRFGTWCGASLAGRPLPDPPWVARALRRAQAAAAAPNITRLAAMRGHPLVRAGWPDGLDEVVLRFWAEDRPRFLDALDGLPQALQHGDPNGYNLFLRPAPGGGDVVAIDWAWLAVTAIGEDLATVINWFGRRAPDGASGAYADRLADAYLAGLRDAGWHGDAGLVRLGYLLTTALRYIAHPLMLALLEEDEAAHTRAEQARGLPVEELLGRAADQVRRALPAAVEARALLGSR